MSSIDSLKTRLLKNSKWNGECLESTYKGRSQSGYALVKYKYSTTGAHRISWIVNFGDIPEGLWVLHKCDNPICVRPEHLFLGTAKENTDDMIKKGRNNYQGRTIFTEEEVNEAIEMRRNGMILRKIAEKLNTNISTLSAFFLRTSSKEKVKDFYAKPKYPLEIRKKAFELRKSGVKCKDIQKMLDIPKKTLSNIFKKGID